MKAWILFFLGTLAYFLQRYMRSNSKVADFSPWFWIKDNWPELAFALVLDFSAMIILMDAGTIVDITELVAGLPVGLVMSSKLLFSFAIGMGLGKGAYEVFKKKVKDSKG